MAQTRRLADIHIDGSGSDQDVVQLAVLAHLPVDPSTATDEDWARAWGAAQDTWERLITSFLKTVPSGSVADAERQAVAMLRRSALLKLEQRTFTDG